MPQDFLDLYFLGCKVRRAELRCTQRRIAACRVCACMSCACEALPCPQLCLRAFQWAASGGCFMRFGYRLQACLRHSNTRQLATTLLTTCDVLHV